MHPLRVTIVRQKACIDAPAVIGPRNDRKAISCCPPSPAKRSSNAAGKRAASTGGMKPADRARQNGVAVKRASHQSRQRTTVRRSTPIVSASLPSPLLCQPVTHRRNQGDDHRQIDLAAEKSQRRWRRAVAAAIDCAAEAKPPVVLFAERHRSATRLARIVRCMQHTAALRTARGAALRRQIAVERQQLLVKLGIRQQGLVQRRPSFPSS